jgi:flagellar hook-length control protein FliK
LTIEKSSLPEIAKELKLTPKETKLVSELNVEKIDLDELKLVIKSKIENNPNNKLLKTLSQKLELVDSSSKSEIVKTGESESKPNLVTKESVPNETKQTEKIKPTLKPENVSDVEKVEDKNTKQSYLLTIKSEKSAESVPFERLAKVETKTPELLKKSIYTSKESIELTKLKVVPINEEVGKKNEIKSADDDFKRLSFKKVSNEQKVINVNDNLKNSNTESDNSSKNNNVFGQSNVITSDLNKAEFSDKNFAKQVAENSNEEIAKTEISKKESSTEVKATEVKNSETFMPKSAFVEHQIRNNDLRVIPKATFKQLDLKNIKEEISSLIQKGEKKSVEFQLNPDNLGKMNIKLEVTNKMVSASIKVENETTQQAVQNSLEGLKNSLNQQGLQLSSLNVSLADADEKNNNRYFKQKKKNNAGLNVKVNGFDDKFAHKNLGYNNYDFIA